MTDPTMLLIGVLIAVGMAIYVISLRDKRSGCFYALLMMVDAVITGAVLLAWLG